MPQIDPRQGARGPKPPPQWVVVLRSSKAADCRAVAGLELRTPARRRSASSTILARAGDCRFCSLFRCPSEGGGGEGWTVPRTRRARRPCQCRNGGCGQGWCHWHSCGTEPDSPDEGTRTDPFRHGNMTCTQEFQVKLRLEFRVRGQVLAREANALTAYKRHPSN